MSICKDNYKEAISEAEQGSALSTGHKVWKLSLVQITAAVTVLPSSGLGSSTEGLSTGDALV